MRKLGSRNTIIGNYEIREARTEAWSPDSEWRVYAKEAIEPLTVCNTRAEAIKAANAFNAADMRRRG